MKKSTLQLITDQQLKIAEYKKLLEQNRKSIKEATALFYGMGQPLNDNVLKFDSDQLKWCVKLMSIINKIN